MIEKGMKALGFDRVLERLAEKAVCQKSKLEIGCLRPYIQHEQVKNQLEKTDCMLSLLLRYGAPEILPCDEFEVIAFKLERAGVLFPKELLRVARLLRCIENLSTWSRIIKEESRLDLDFNRLKSLKGLCLEIEKIVISEDELSDDASATLFRIRANIREAAADIRTELNRLRKLPDNQKYLQESAITIRNGRFTLPVKSEHRAAVAGLVQDASSSGSTFFIEPAGVVERNNKIRVLEAKEKEEEMRILKELSGRIFEELEVLKENYNLVIFFDVLLAKARLALEMEAFMPVLVSDGVVDLKAARHPLLSKETVVPIDVKLGGEFGVVVITGPNTGGKTVTLKTIGLLVLMTMSGLLIPAKEGSVVSTFEQVLVDVGDEQSIEQNLSTFSGHMSNLVQFLRLANEKSLVLVDELGSGTDPVEGAGLAIAILTELACKKAKVMATTHYAELKMFALSSPGVQNASCEFDMETLRPTYKLIQGLPGRSNAFAIAEKLGLEHRLIEKARASLNENNLRFENVLQELGELKQREHDQMEQNRELRAKLLEEHQKLEGLKAELLKEEEKRIADFKAQTEPLMQSLKKAFAQTADEMSQIRKENDVKKLEELRIRLKSDLAGQLEKVYAKQKKKQPAESNSFKKGEVAFAKNLGRECVLTSDPDKNAMVCVRAGNIATRIAVFDLQKMRGSVKQTKSAVSFKGSVSRVSKRVKREVHLRGLTVYEALDKLDKFIDDAVISGLHEVVVVHGKGTGVLKSAIHDYLRSAHLVKSFRLGRYGEGEDGVTIVEL